MDPMSTAIADRSQVQVCDHLYENHALAKSRWLPKISTHVVKFSELIRFFTSQTQFIQSGAPLSPASEPRLGQHGKTLKNHYFHSTPSIACKTAAFLAAQTKNYSPGQISNNTHAEKIELVKDEGYENIVKKIEKIPNDAKQMIFSLSSFSLIEQLVDLFNLLEGDQTLTETIMPFAFQVALIPQSTFSKHSHPDYQTLSSISSQIIGMIIYFTEHHPDFITGLISKRSFCDILDCIQDEFSHEIELVYMRLHELEESHKKAGLQSAELAVITRLPAEIAKLLLTKKGTINTGIIDRLKQAFLPNVCQLSDHQINIYYALKILKSSAKFRSEFEKIQKLPIPRSSMEEVIHISQHLEFQEQVNIEDVRLAVLTALMSHLRQGENGSCFATSLAIEILTSSLILCLKDLRQLQEQNKLSRTLNGISKDIPFSRKINDETLKQKIQFNRKGTLIKDKKKAAPLWEAPGIQAVSSSLGIPDPKKIFEIILDSLRHKFPEKTLHEMEISKLLGELCHFAGLKSKNSLDKACFIFSSQTANPLLKIWENTIAGMAEAEESSMIKVAITRAIIESLDLKLSDLKILPSPLLLNFFLLLQQKISKAIHLRYDPLLPQESSAAAKKSDHGFVLYQDIMRIDNPDTFQEFVQNLFIQVIEEIKLYQPLVENQFMQTIQLLFSFIGTPLFITYLLVRYHPQNKELFAQKQLLSSFNFDKLRFTPWITRTGNHSEAVLRVYFESSKSFSYNRCQITNAFDALQTVIDVCRNMPEEEKHLFTNNPYKLKPASILGKHRLSIIPCHPTLKNAWTSSAIPTQEWIHTHVINPGLVVANSKIGNKAKTKLLNKIKEELTNQINNPEELHSILNYLKQISCKLSYKEFRQEIYTIFSLSTNCNTHLNEWMLSVDSNLYETLNEEMKRSLHSTIVHIADTNWIQESHDVHFCFVVNPGNGLLEMWKILSNDSHLTAIDQTYWVKNQIWEFLTHLTQKGQNE